MKITANEEYGLRIILRIALLIRENPDKLVALNKIAEDEGISVENTAAMITKLREGGFVESVRGKYGGYKMAKEPKEINLHQILSALSKDTFGMDFCDSHSGRAENCVHQAECSIRPVWSNVNKLINNFLASISLETLMDNEACATDNIENSFNVLQRMTEESLEDKKEIEETV